MQNDDFETEFLVNGHLSGLNIAINKPLMAFRLHGKTTSESIKYLCCVFFWEKFTRI